MSNLQLNLVYDEKVYYKSDISTILKDFIYFGNPTIVEIRNNIPFFINEFWTARQRQGHSLHEVSYRACFKPQLPEFFIERLTNPGDTVYDPFMGRGTTPLQAVLMRRNAVGNDINPLSSYLVRPRTNPPTIRQIESRLNSLNLDFSGSNDTELLVFYHEDTLKQIQSLRRYLIDRQNSGEIDLVDEWIRMVAINRLTGHSSGFFSVYSLPPNQAVSVGSQQKINEKRNQIPPFRDVKKIILKKSKSLLKDISEEITSSATFHVGSAEETPYIENSSVDLVVTSPPFLDIVQYANDNWLRCWFAGMDSADVPITMLRKPEDWTAFVSRVFTEFSRIVRPGGHVCFEVGEVRNGSIQLEDLVIEAMSGLPFDIAGVMINVQEFTKTSNVWGVDNNSKGTNTNRVIIARRT